MSQDEPTQKPRKSGPLEVVSEEQADGSFEIKFQSKEHTVPGAEDEAVSGEQERVTGESGGPAAYIGLLVVVVLLGAGAWLLFVSPRGSEREPARVNPEISAPESTPAATGGESTPSTPSRQLQLRRRRPDLPARQAVERTLLRRDPESVQVDRPGPMRIRPDERTPSVHPSTIDHPGLERVDPTELTPVDEATDGRSRRIRHRGDRPVRRTRTTRRTPNPPAEPAVEPAPEAESPAPAVDEEPLIEEETEVDWGESDEEVAHESDENLDRESDWDDEGAVDDEGEGEYDDEYDEDDEEAYDDEEYDDQYDEEAYDDEEYDDQYDDQYDDEEQNDEYY